MQTLNTTPWGRVQETQTIAPGVFFLSTASHGGIFLSPEINSTVPDSIKDMTFCGQGFQGFYEEDEDAELVRQLLPQLFTL